MLRQLTIAVVLAVSTLCFSSFTLAGEPTFNDFSVPLKVAEPIIKKGTLAAQYPTKIREGVAEGPTFAGRYAVIVIGNGTMGQFGFIENVLTGDVYNLPVSAGGYDYRLKSRLLIVNPKLTDDAGEPVFNPIDTEYWVWALNGAKTFTQISAKTATSMLGN